MKTIEDCEIIMKMENGIDHTTNKKNTIHGGKYIVILDTTPK